MPERIFIGVAWPYANGWLHLGHVAGCYLPADIFARYHRLKGNEVLMVSGSDQHGTPITIQAEAEGLSPQALASKYHDSFVRCWDLMGIKFDLFTSTGTENHREVVHKVFTTLKEKGYIYSGTMPLPYCHVDDRFLPDRYVEGTCPFCAYPNAKGDQCESCGKPMNPQELLVLRCRLCGGIPEIKESEHLFLRLSAFQETLLQWMRKQYHWRPNVRNSTIRFLEDGLQDRAITRDIRWGIPIPVDGFEEKRIYVWFEAVIGYLSASIEWSLKSGYPEAWREFWEDKGTKSYYFIGKDNIPFHSIIWPAILMGYEGLDLPYDVPANEFLNMQGGKISTSKNWAVWLPDYLERYSADPLRYYLSANMPETSDSDFSWRDYVRRNNDELVSTYGNLVHRVLTFTYRNFSGQVPQPGDLNSEDMALLALGKSALKQAGNSFNECHFRDALKTAMQLAREANRYLDFQSPWKSLKLDRRRCATVLWSAITIISCLRVITYPFMPSSAQKLHILLGFSGDVEEMGWSFQPVPAGQVLVEPEPLFTKLDDSVVDVEEERLGKVNAN